MDMALEMGNSVTSLGAAMAARPDGSFCVVPPGSSYMSSSSMWTSGIMGVAGGNSQQQQQKQHERSNTMPQKGTAGVRSRANHLQNFLGGNNRLVMSTHAHSPAPVQETTTPVAASSSTSGQMSLHQKGDQIVSNPALESSWWGGGQGSMMSSVLASSAIHAAATSNQRHPPNSEYNQTRKDYANTKQLIQLMDSLNRLGNENAQLLREVEEAKAARAEAKAAREMMAQFKAEYSHRFMKVKEALEKYPKHANVNNPVANR